MINTELKIAEADLNDVITAFGAEETDIKHLFSRKEGKVVNTFVINGRSFAYGNLLPDIKNETEEKRYVKRFAKLSLYKALSVVLSKTLPWGSLTGIRPTKLAYSTIEENGEFYDYFVETLKVSEKKARLTKKVIESQKGIYNKDSSNTDFFIFVPFCPSRCRYCSFISADIKSAQSHVEEYVDCLIDEINSAVPLIRKLRSIYIGGGTPVALSNAQLDRILSAVDKFNGGVEFTVEAGRPDRINAENVKILKDHGVTRICINPQTFNDRTLSIIGRNHTAEDVVDRYIKYKDGFLVNMDLIAGLDGEDFSDFSNSVKKAVELSPDNITIHTLCVKRGSYLSDEVKRLSAGEIEKMVDFGHEYLFTNGYNPYYLYRQKYMAGNLENTGYSKKGKECVYNIDVMEEISQNIACGASAISKAVSNDLNRIERYANPKDVVTYLKKAEAIKTEKEKLFKEIKL